MKRNLYAALGATGVIVGVVGVLLMIVVIPPKVMVAILLGSLVIVIWCIFFGIFKDAP